MSVSPVLRARSTGPSGRALIVEVRSMRSSRVHEGSRESLRRPTDLVEDAMAWVLPATGLLACMMALVVGTQVYGDGAARARAEAVERTPVQAVVLGQPRTSVAAYAGIRSPRAVRLPVAVRYTAPNGVERDGA